MFTPQQIEQISFSRATFGGYDMQSVDEFLEPLTEDYITLYKENALLKSKMRVLVGKLEEYRKNEASMKDAIVNAQKTCDMMVKEAEAKCTQMLSDANAAAAENAKFADALAQRRGEVHGKEDDVKRYKHCLDAIAFDHGGVRHQGGELALAVMSLDLTGDRPLGGGIFSFCKSCFHIGFSLCGEFFVFICRG